MIFMEPKFALIIACVNACVCMFVHEFVCVGVCVYVFVCNEQSYYALPKCLPFPFPFLIRIPKLYPNPHQYM